MLDKSLEEEQATRWMNVREAASIIASEDRPPGVKSRRQA
jgi:hypothetical protein